jgi:biopolymer transport protein ExbB
MWLLLFCSVVAWAVFLERVVYFHRITVRVGDLMRGVARLVQNKRFTEAQVECATAGGPVARVLHAAITQHRAPKEELRVIVQEAGQLEVPRLERRLGVLATLAFLSPLTGLLGTVGGLIDAFRKMDAQSGLSSSADLAGGIYQALLTTGAGLAVAILCAVGYAYLSARVNAFLHEMERAGIEIVHLIVQCRAASDIIEFDRVRSVAVEARRGDSGA